MRDFSYYDEGQLELEKGNLWAIKEHLGVYKRAKFYNGMRDPVVSKHRKVLRFLIQQLRGLRRMRGRAVGHWSAAK